MNLTKQQRIEVSIALFTKTIEMIKFSLQLENAFKKNIIRPEDFEKKITFPDKIELLDWTKDPKMFGINARNIQFASSGYFIIICKETYGRIEDIFVEKKDNDELYSAQKIQQIVRGVHAHFSPETHQFCKPIYDLKEEQCVLYEVKSIGVTLDARNKNGEEFDFNHLGGMGKYISLLDYLKKDLQNRFSE